MSVERARLRVGRSVDDWCRPCKSERRHTVTAASGDGAVVRVICDYCGSQHNYRGGGRPRSSPAAKSDRGPGGGALPLVSERERSVSPMSLEAKPGAEDLELLLRRVIREEAGLSAVAPSDRWRGGELVLRPGREGVQEKSWPIETFFHKIVMLRNRLRMLEQQINGSDLPADVKLKLQGYITGCYGTLTSFNVLFAEEDDRFRGSRGQGSG